VCRWRCGCARSCAPPPATSDARPTRSSCSAASWSTTGRPRLVSGGWTGTASRSEAAAGREHLVAAGVPDAAIETEERSRHTLENLFYVRESLRARGLGRVVLVSDPLHLARAAALAHGLALDFTCSPAIGAPPQPGAPAWWARALREAFLLHWYHVGVVYSRAIGSERLLARVT